MSRRVGVAGMATAITLLAGCGGLAPNVSSSGSTLAASAPALDFGNVARNKTADLSETLTNSGASDITILSASTSDADFTLSGLTLPATLASNQTLTFKVTFSPKSSGSSTASLALVSDAANSTLNVTLDGTGEAAGQLSVTPATLEFGDVVDGAQAWMKGALSADGSAITVTAASIDSSVFAISDLDLPVTIENGRSIPFTVIFQPAVSGNASSALSFSSDASNSPAPQSLTGNGTAASQHSVDLHWDAVQGAGLAGYNIYRSNASEGPFAQINATLASASDYTDGAVSAGETYFYVTTSVTESGGESANSNRAKAVIPSP